VGALHKAFRADLAKVQDDLTVQLDGIMSIINVTLETTEKVLNVSEKIKGNSNDIISKLGKVTNVVDKIADTMQSYHNILVTRQAQTYKASTPSKVLGDIECKAKQILIDIFDEEGNNTLEKSLEELIDKANKVLGKMSDIDKLKEVKVEATYKTRRNTILLTLNSKEAANWVRELSNKVNFANAFSKGVHICEREYILVMPGVPLTFNPENTAHLREIEETNSLPKLIICKVRWIKLVERRRKGQTLAHAILTVTLVNTTNKLIKEGLRICSSMLRPMKQKIEPIQCIKCR
jgi:hypothetical protein